MLHRIFLGSLVVVAAAASAWAVTPDEASLSTSSAVAEPEDRAAAEPIRPIEPHTALDPAKVALGGKLFREARLSSDGTISCATCHHLRRGGVDLLPRAIGVGEAINAFNTPTVYNAWRNPMQFWDGRADSLEAQVDGPLTSATEMGSSWAAAVATLQGDPDYVRRFAASYRGGITPAAVADAIATFERSLTTSGSRFNRFLRGATTELTPGEAEGYRAFKSYGCASCHQGANVGGNLLATFGVFGDYFVDSRARAARGSRALQRHAARRGSAPVPGPQPAARGGHAPLLPRRLGGHAGGGRADHGPLPGRPRDWRGGRGSHRGVPADLAGRRGAA